MCPAQLQKSTGAVLMVLEVGREAVRDDNAVKGVSQDGAYDLGRPCGLDGKKCEGTCDKCPEPGQ